MFFSKMALVFTLIVYIFTSSATHAAHVPMSMRALRAIGACSTPFPCVDVKSVPTPTPKRGEVLIRVNATSVNPSDVDTVEAGGCDYGCGADVAGMVVACPSCKRLKIGDTVWTLAQNAYSEYVVGLEAMTGHTPRSIDVHSAGTIPEVGLTSLLSLKRTGSMPGSPLPAGSPWANGNFSNLTVLITAGAGGTGFIGIELAKAWGAKHIATSSTGEDGLQFVKSLGATYVVDYKTQDIFSTLPDNSIDIVYDNYGAEGTADKAMRVIRPGGVYLLMPHGECFSKKTQGPPCLSANPKKGVRQVNYVTGDDFGTYALQGLDELRDLFDAGRLSPRIAKSFSLGDIAKAFSYSAGSGEGGVGHHFGKIAITLSLAEDSKPMSPIVV